MKSNLKPVVGTILALCSLFAVGCGGGKDSNSGATAPSGQGSASSALSCAGLDFTQSPGTEISVAQFRGLEGSYRLTEGSYYNYTHLEDGSEVGDDRRIYEVSFSSSEDGQSSSQISTGCSSHSGTSLRLNFEMRFLAGLRVARGRIVLTDIIHASASGYTEEAINATSRMQSSQDGLSNRFEDFIENFRRSADETMETHIYRLANNDIEIRNSYIKNVDRNRMQMQLRMRLAFISPVASTPPSEPAVNSPAAIPAPTPAPPVTSTTQCRIRGLQISIGDQPVASYNSLADATSEYRWLMSQRICQVPSGVCSISGLTISIGGSPVSSYNGLRDAVNEFKWLLEQHICTAPANNCALRGLTIYVGGAPSASYNNMRDAVSEYNRTQNSGVCL